MRFYMYKGKSLFKFRELDLAMLRRLEKRILVSLPTKEARERMFEHYLPNKISANQNGVEITTKLDYEVLGQVTCLTRNNNGGIYQPPSQGCLPYRYQKGKKPWKRGWEYI